VLAPDKQYCKWLLRYVTIVRFFKVWEGHRTQIVKTIYLCDNAQSAVRLELAQIDCVSSFRFLLQTSSCKNQTPHAESTQMLCPSKAKALEGSKFLTPKHWGKIFLQTKTPESSLNSSLQRWRTSLLPSKESQSVLNTKYYASKSNLTPCWMNPLWA